MSSVGRTRLDFGMMRGEDGCLVNLICKANKHFLASPRRFYINSFTSSLQKGPRVSLHIQKRSGLHISTSTQWCDIRKIISLLEARNIVIRHEIEVHARIPMMKNHNPAPLAPPSKLHVGILVIAIRNDVLGRSS